MCESLQQLEQLAIALPGFSGSLLDNSTYIELKTCLVSAIRAGQVFDRGNS